MPNVYEAFSFGDRTVTGKVIGDITIDFCKTLAGVAVSQSGMILTELGVGKYILMNPNITERTICSGYLTIDSTKSFSVMFDPVDGAILFDANSYVKSTPQTPVSVTASQLTDGTIYTDKTATLSEDLEIIRGNTMTLTFPLATGWDLLGGKKAKCCIKATPTTPNASAIVDRDCTILGAQSCSIDLTALETAVVGAYVGTVEVLNANDSVVGEAFWFSVRIIQDRRQ